MTQRPQDSSPSKTSLSYKDAGVDIDAGNALVERIKGVAKRTHRPEVMGGLGGFGEGRMPQLEQSDPGSHTPYSEPGPPSSHWPSPEWRCASPRFRFSVCSKTAWTNKGRGDRRTLYDRH